MILYLNFCFYKMYEVGILYAKDQRQKRKCTANPGIIDQIWPWEMWHKIEREAKQPNLILLSFQALRICRYSENVV